jgi:hypothetical protein
MEEPIFNPFLSEEITPPFSEHWTAKRRVAHALRELIDVLVTSTPTVEDMNEIAASLEQQASAFAETPRRYGLAEFVDDGDHGGHGEVNHELNAVGGWSNPLSPGLNMWFEGGVAVGTVRCGYAYEGPPGHIHGGYVAAIFDQFMGMAQMMGKLPGMTGTLNVRYLRPTPLNTELNLRAELDRQDGRKTYMTGTMQAGEVVTATCTALFVRPNLGMRNLR